MSFRGIVGKIVDSVEIEWELENFFSLSKTVDDRYHSPAFNVSGRSFYLMLYPNGESHDNSEGYIRLYLTPRESCVPITIGYAMGIKTSEGDIETWFYGVEVFQKKGDGWGDFIKLHKRELKRRKRELVPYGTLTFTAIMKTNEPENHTQSPMGTIRQAQCTLDCKEISWEIKNIVRLLDNKSGFISSGFSFDDVEYNLYCQISESTLIIYVCVTGYSFYCLSWSMGILSADGVERLTGSGMVQLKEHYQKSHMVGMWVGPSRCDLLQNRETMIPAGVLTVFFRISTQTQVARKVTTDVAVQSDVEAETIERPQQPDNTDTNEIAIQTDDDVNDLEGCDRRLPSDNSGTTEASAQTDEDINVENVNELSRQSPKMTGLTSLGRSLKEVYETGEDCDVTLKVKDKKFRAHRLILRARTPVLAAMFSHNMTEAETGVVCVEDCHPDAFEIFLLFVYSGMAENLTKENVTQVYYTADKYDLPELREECVWYMLSNLDIDSVCSILDLATRHGEEVLLEKAIDFFLQNAREIFRLTSWRKFMVENDSLAGDLIIRSHENAK